jgi:UDP-glucose 4-epimerase
LTEHHLILGGSGFVGRHVAVLLAQAGHRVTLADRLPLDQDFTPDIASQVSWQLLELGTADWDALVADADVVHFYAWGSLPATANANPGGDLSLNVGAMIDMLDALHRRGHGRVVFTSSGGTVYGKLQHIPVSEGHPSAPITAYGAGKASAEIYLGLYRAMHGIDCRIARISNLYGAGQNLTSGLGAVTTFLHHALTGQRITIWGTGEVVRDYIHISDAAKCLCRLATIPHGEEFVFNVGSGVGINLNEIIGELERRLCCKLDILRTATRPFDVPISVLDIARARAVLAWAPILSFSDGIARTLKDLQDEKYFSTLD